MIRINSFNISVFSKGIMLIFKSIYKVIFYIRIRGFFNIFNFYFNEDEDFFSNFSIV